MALVELAAVLAAMLWIGWAATQPTGLRDAPVRLVGPDVVTSALAEMAEAEAGDRLDVTTFTESPRDREAARAGLSSGEAVAVLELDLTGTSDRLLLPPVSSPRRDRAVIDQVRRMEDVYDRSVEVVRPSPEGLEPAGPPPQVSTPTRAMVAVALGVVAALVVSLWRGPVAASFAAGTRRFLLLTGVAVATSSLSVLVGDGAQPAIWLGLACLAGGTVTLACEVIGGLRAVTAATLLLIAAPLPLVIAGDRWLLAEPWRTVSDWSVVGAAAAAMGRVPGEPIGGRPELVVIATVVLAMVILLGWRTYAPRVAAGLSRDRSQSEDGEAGDAAVPVMTVAAARRRLVTLTVSLAAFAVLSQVGWQAVIGEESESSLPSLASATRCIRTGTVTTTADLNRIAQLRGSPAMRGGDVGASARLQEGRRLWMFGDTIRGSGGDGFVRNSMLLVEPGCLEVVLPQSGGAIIPDRPDGVGYWPMSVVVSSFSGYDLVTVTAQRVRTVDATDVFGFESLGPAVALYVVPLGQTPQLISQHDLGPDAADTTRQMWGAATAIQDGFLYLYGTARDAQVELGKGFSLAVARVPVESVADDRRWRYWTGSDWSPDPRRVATLIDERDGVSQTLSVFTRGGRWFALSKRNEVLGQDVVIWTAPGPTGPFVAQPPVASIPSDPETGELRYMPLAHPGLLPRAGTVVISYSRNRTDVSDVVAEPRRYRPAFLRVPLPGS